MKIQKLDHYTLRTPHLEETREFLETVAGLQCGPRPAFGFTGYWLYADGRPIVHLANEDPSDMALQRYLGARTGTQGGGAVDHIAFRCEGLPAFEAKLLQLGISYLPRTVPELREHQVFLCDPNMLNLEFIFDAAENASWETDRLGVAIAHHSVTL